MRRSTFAGSGRKPRFEPLEPRLLLSADLPIVPLSGPAEYGDFLFHRSLLAESLLIEQGEPSLVDQMSSVQPGRVAAAAGTSASAIGGAPEARRDGGSTASQRAIDADREQRQRADALISQGRSPSGVASEALARYGQTDARGHGGHNAPTGAPETRADLRLTEIDAPEAAQAGSRVTIEWILQNLGEGATPDTGWHDAVYFSRDQRFDAGDLLLATSYAHPSEGLDAGETRTRSAQVEIPDHLDEGYLLVLADRFGHVEEASETDNTAAAAVRVIGGGYEQPGTDTAALRGGASTSGDVQSIAQAQAQALSNALEAFSRFAERISEVAEFAQDLPLLSFGEDSEGVEQLVSITDVFGETDGITGLGASVQAGLIDPLVDFLDDVANGVSEGTTEDLAQLLGSLATVDAASVDGGAFDAPDGGRELRFDLVFTDTATLASIPIAPGENAEDEGLGLKGDATLDLSASVEFGFSFGLTLDDTLAPDEAFFVRDGAITLGGSFVGAGSLNFGANLGFLDVAVEDGSATLDLTINASLLNPDGDAAGNITQEEFAGEAIGSLVDVSAPAAPYSLTLPISAEVDGLGGASATVSLSGDAFSGMAPAFSVDAGDFDPFQAFTNIDAFNFGGLLDQLAAWFSDLSGSGLFDQEVPFTASTIGEVLNLGEPVGDLVDALISPETGEASFSSVQTLSDVLSQVLTQPGESEPGLASVAFDPATDELTFQLEIEAGAADGVDFGVPPVEQPLAFDYELPEGLGGISSSATLSLSASAVFMLTMGVKLQPLGAGVPRLERSTRLADVFRAAQDDVPGIRTEAGVDDFRVIQRDGTTFDVNLDAIGDIGGVLDAINDNPDNTAVTAAISEDGYGITLTDASEGTTRFRVQTLNDSLAAFDLGINLQDLDDEGIIEGLPLHGDSLAERFFLRDTGVEAGLSIGADDLTASATFGFLELGLGNDDDPGSASLDLSASIAIEGAGGPGENVFLNELYEAVGNDGITQFVSEPALSGSAMAVLPVTGVAGDVIGALTGDPRIVVSFDDLSARETRGVGAPDISLEGFDELLDFQNLGVSEVIGALNGVVDLLQTFEGFDFLDFPLPLIDRSIADILAFADSAAMFVDQFTSTDEDAGTPTLLTNLEQRLDDALAEIPFTMADSVIDVDRSGADAALRFGLTFQDRFDESLPLDLDLVELIGGVVDLPEQVGDLLSVGGSGEIGVDAGYAFTVDVGIDLGTLEPFVYGSTGVVLDFIVEATDINLEVALGPLTAGIVGGEASISQEGSGDPVTLEFGVLGDADARVGITDFGFDDIGLETAPTVGVVADLPVQVLGSVLPDSIGFRIADLINDPGNVTDVTFPDLASAFSSLDLVGQLNVAVDGLDLILGGISDALDGEILGINLPLVGDNLAGAVSFIDDFRVNILQAFSDQLDKDPALAFDTLANLLEDVLGEDGLDFLRGDVEVLFDGVPADMDTGGVDQIEFVVPLGTTFSVDDLPRVAFDLGFPGLSLDVDGDVNFELEFGWDLQFGVSRDDGFFFDVSASPTRGDDPRSAELFLDFTASIPELEATGTLAILRIMVEDLAGSRDFGSDPVPVATELGALFGLDIVDPNDDGKLTFNELASAGLGSLFEPVVEVDAQVNLAIRADFGGLSDDIASIFPAIDADLYFAAGLNALSGELDISELRFDEIRLDAGALLGDFLIPIVQEIGSALDPFDPFVETLTSPVPVISDISGEDVSLVDLAVRLGGAFGLNLSWLNAVVDILDLVEFVQGLSPEDIAGGIPLGELDLLPAMMGGMDDGFEDLDLNSYGGANANMNAMDDAMSSGAGETLSRSRNIRGGGFSFPLLSDPLSAIGLLLGQEATLFEYDMAPLVFRFTYSQFFSVIGPLGVRLTGSIGAEVNLGFGYDTVGINKAINLINGFSEPSDAEEAAQQAGQVALAVIDGFYLIDRVEVDGELVERTEAKLTGSLSAAVELNIVVAAAGVEGGIEATFNADLNDLNDDGRVRLSEVVEIIEQTENFACLFEFSGSLEAFLDAYARVGFPPLGKRWDYELARVTLLSFSFDCRLNDPVLARQEGDTLILHMGPEAGAREFGDTADGPEQFRVSQVSDGVMRVQAFDLDQQFGSAGNPIRNILGQGGAGGDVIEIAANVQADTELYGGFRDDPLRASGDDQLVGGSGNNQIFGGDGEDSITGGDNPSRTDNLVGGDGVDTIIGRRGTDMIEGGPGADLLFGREGDDMILGDGGADEIYGETGADMLFGGEGNDQIRGGDGDDTIFGEAGDDFIFGELGADTIDGGTGLDVIDGVDFRSGLRSEDNVRDVIRGGDEADLIHALGGDSLTQGNIVIAGLGNDRVFTGDGADLVFGDLDDPSVMEGGDDEIETAGGADEIRAGLGGDTISAGDGDDVIFADLVFAGAPEGFGLDTVNAGDGDDLVFGTPRTDLVFGGDGADRILGGAGDDELRGQTGDDTILGGQGLDMIFGDDGEDRLFGDDDADEILGGAGDDLIVAGTGLGDRLFGGLGMDTIFGSDDAPADGRSGGPNEPGARPIVRPDASSDARRGADGARATTLRGDGPTGDYIDGGADDDAIYARGGNDEVYGSLGNDFIHAGTGFDVVFAGGGDDFVYGGLGVGNELYGEAGMDEIWGSDGGDDLIDGGDDDDDIFGQGGADTIFGRAGADTIDGGTGRDEIRGGDGDDVIEGGGWGDLIFGDAGDDLIGGSDDGDDEIYGGADDDTIMARGSNDFVDAGTGADTVDGGLGDDLLMGNAGQDLIAGAGDHDVIYGFLAMTPGDDGADDVIYGDDMDGLERDTDGRDRIFGGAGSDEMYGQGDDDFIDPGPGLTEVIDYGSGERPIQEDFVPPLPTDPRDPLDREPTDFEEPDVPARPVIDEPALPAVRGAVAATPSAPSPTPGGPIGRSPGVEVAAPNVVLTVAAFDEPDHEDPRETIAERLAL